MRKAFAIAVLMGFVAIAVFGFAAMGSNGGHGHNDCIASMANGTECSETPPGTFDSFHLDAYRNFSLGILATAASVLFAALAAWTLAFGFVFELRAPLPAFFGGLCLRDRPPERAHEKLIRWLAFHETSPTAFSGARL